MSEIDPGRVPDDHPARIANDSVRPADAANATELLADMLAGAFPEERVLAFHELHLRKCTPRGVDRGNVWAVYHPYESEPVEVLNLTAFRSTTELENCLGRLRTSE